VLGNLACAANPDFITNSDPEILENLKNCNDLSSAQISAMEAVLNKGTSKYGQVILILNDLLSTDHHYAENIFFSPDSVH